MKKLLFLTIILLNLAACGSVSEIDQEQPKSSSPKVERIENSSDTFNQDKDQIKSFVTAYVERSFDDADLDKKIRFLSNQMSDTALADTAILEDLEAYRQQVKVYHSTKQLPTSASLVLVERRLLGLSITRLADQYQVRVTYEETSPAVSGTYKVNKVFLVTLTDKKIEQMIEK